MLIKVLVVEDDLEKRRLILEASLSVPGIEESSFEYATDVISAKKQLKSTRFDLVILDINLPKRPSLKAEVGAGLEVLSFLKLNKQANLPTCLFGLTACDASASMAEKEFSSPLWKLVRFSYSDAAWKSFLRDGLLHLLKTKRPPYFNDGNTFHVDLAIITALPEELDQVLRLDGSWRSFCVPNEDSTYHKGIFTSADGAVSVVATAAPSMGMPVAAVCASKLIHNFRPRVLAMTGICAGVRGKCELGDILIADPCFDWGSGKWVKEDDELRFSPALYPWRLEPGLRAKMEFTARSETLQKIHSSYNGNKPPSFPACKIDAMASGGSVLQAEPLVNNVKELHKNLIGIEMESYSVFCAAVYAANPKPYCISIKSACDFGDEFKDNSYRNYAAYTSAMFLYHFSLEHLIKPREE